MSKACENKIINVTIYEKEHGDRNGSKKDAAEVSLGSECRINAGMPHVWGSKNPFGLRNAESAEKRST